MGALSDDTVWRLSVWRLSRTSGRRAACAAGRLHGAYWLIGPGSAGLAQGCCCALPLRARAGAYRGGRPPTACYFSKNTGNRSKPRITSRTRSNDMLMMTVNLLTSKRRETDISDTRWPAFGGFSLLVAYRVANYFLYSCLTCCCVMRYLRIKCSFIHSFIHSSIHQLIHLCASDCVNDSRCKMV